MPNVKGIYCLEVGEWYGEMRGQHSVEPVLELLRRSPANVPYIHRDIATESELRFYIRKWVQSKQAGYPLLYLAFHGSPGFIELRKENGRIFHFPIEDLFAMLEGKCAGRVIHFGSCGVIDIHGHTSNRYLRQSGALAISGFKENIDWTESACFEMLLFAEHQRQRLNRDGMFDVQKRLKAAASGIAKRLGFTMKIEAPKRKRRLKSAGM